MDGFNGENQPSHPELLSLLSRELVDSGFDLKHVIRCVCNSRVYQRSSRVVAGNEPDLRQQKRAVLEELFNALLHKLMTGEICVDQLDLSVLPASPTTEGATT